MATVTAPASTSEERKPVGSRSVFARQAAKSYARYRGRIEFNSKLIGGIPKDPSLIEAWIRAKMGITDEQELRRMVILTLQEEGVDVSGVLEDPESDGKVMITDERYKAIMAAASQVAETSHTTGFKVDAAGVYLESRTLKACLRENTNICYAQERWGATRKGPKSFLAERVFVRTDAPDDRIYIRRHGEPTEGEIVAKYDDLERFIGHVQDKAGRRSTLGYHEFVEGAYLDFEVEVLDDSIKDEWWAKIWISAERNGLGALRSQGFGMFEISTWERIA